MRNILKVVVVYWLEIKEQTWCLLWHPWCHTNWEHMKNHNGTYKCRQWYCHNCNATWQEYE